MNKKWQECKKRLIHRGKLRVGHRTGLVHYDAHDSGDHNRKQQFHMTVEDDATQMHGNYVCQEKRL